jgi:hypothetical protein
MEAAFESEKKTSQANMAALDEKQAMLSHALDEIETYGIPSNDHHRRHKVQRQHS